MSEIQQYKINLPMDVKEFLDEQAKKNVRSRSGELIKIVRDKMEKQEQPADA